MQSLDDDPSSRPDLLYVRHQTEDDEDNQQGSTRHETTFQGDLPSIVSTINENVSKLLSDITKVVDKKVTSVGIWVVALNLVKVTENKNLKQYIPRVINGSFYLDPFEALFLLECRSLAITYHEIPLSIEDAYRLLLPDKRHFKLYRVFSILSKSGYCLKRCPARLSACSPKSEELVQMEAKHLIDEEGPGSSNEDQINKKQKLDHHESKTLNYKAVTSIRTLSFRHLRKFSRLDEKLRSCFKPDEESPKSILYCVRDSVVPVEVNKRLQHLYTEDLRPLVDFSAIHSSEQLYERMQSAGPKCNQDINLLEELPDELNLSVDFEVFPPRTNQTSVCDLLFTVVIVSENDPLPSIAAIKTLRAQCTAPIFFALISDSLEFNFYGLETFAIDNEYPKLWEKYYAAGGSISTQ